MDLILASIEGAVNCGALLPAIITALTIPDIAGAVESPQHGSQVRYISWFDQFFANIHPMYSAHGIDGAAMYGLRCKLLHEGLSSPATAPVAAKSAVASRKQLIAFNVGTGAFMHLCTNSNAAGDSWTLLRAEAFCGEMSVAARAWISQKRNDPNAMSALQKLVDIRTKMPGFHGMPMICAEV